MQIVQQIAAHKVTAEMIVIKDRSGYDGTCIVWAEEPPAQTPAAAADPR